MMRYSCNPVDGVLAYSTPGTRVQRRTTIFSSSLTLVCSAEPEMTGKDLIDFNTFQAQDPASEPIRSVLHNTLDFVEPLETFGGTCSIYCWRVGWLVVLGLKVV